METPMIMSYSLPSSQMNLLDANAGSRLFYKVCVFFQHPISLVVYPDSGAAALKVKENQ